MGRPEENRKSGIAYAAATVLFAFAVRSAEEFCHSGELVASLCLCASVVISLSNS